MPGCRSATAWHLLLWHLLHCDLLHHHHLLRLLFATPLCQQEGKHSIQRNETDQPARPIWNGWRRGCSNGNLDLSRSCWPIHSYLKNPCPLYSDLSCSL